MVFIKPTLDKLVVLKRLLSALRLVEIGIKCLYADKGLCCIPVLRYLSARHRAAIIALPFRGKQAARRALCRGSKSYRTTFTLQNAKNGSVTVPVAVVRTYQRRRSGQRQLCWFLYVVLGSPGRMVEVRRGYRWCFGIESGYRLIEQVRVRTTSRNPALRLLLMGVVLLIVNMWIHLHWLFLRLPERGAKRVARWRFWFERMRHFLTCAVGQFYGLTTAINLTPI